MFTALLAALVLLPQTPAPAPPPAPGASARALHEQLARAIDLPSVDERRSAADELARTSTATLAEWGAACASFGTFAPLAAGPAREQVPLRVLERIDRVEVFLYVPPGLDPARPAPLLLWGHGAGGTGAGQHGLWQAVADRIGLLVLAFTSTESAPGYHFSPRERATALAVLRWARRRANVDENAIFVGGWSQGGHLAWDLALRHPDLFAGAIPVVGGPRLELGPKNNLRYLENVAQLPLHDLQGAQDDPLLLANLRLAFARLAKLGAKRAQLVEFADRGHDADLAAVDWPTFFAHRRTPQPRRVVRVAADPAETRAHWLELTRFGANVAPDSAPSVRAGFDTMPEAEQRAHVLDRYATVTARLVAEDKGQGRFQCDGAHVNGFALLLTAAQLGKDGAVEVRLASKPLKKKAVAETAVLLREFVERFDRTFLPVARVVVP